MTDPTRVLVHEVVGITQHEHAENLTLVALKDHDRLLVANKQDSGSFRYAPGDLVVLLPVGAILPEYLLREMGAWDDVKQKGTLASNRGNRVGPRKFAALDGGEERYESRGALRPVNRFATDDSTINQVVNNQGLPMVVVHGWDVTEHLGIEMRG